LWHSAPIVPMSRQSSVVTAAASSSMSAACTINAAHSMRADRPASSMEATISPMESPGNTAAGMTDEAAVA